MNRKKARALQRQAAKDPTRELTEKEAMQAYNFPDMPALDKFALQLDAMALMMYEKKINDRPAMVDYIDKTFSSTKEKILAAIFVGSKVTENEWVAKTAGKYLENGSK